MDVNLRQGTQHNEFIRACAASESLLEWHGTWLPQPVGSVASDVVGSIVRYEMKNVPLIVNSSVAVEGGLLIDDEVMTAVVWFVYAVTKLSGIQPAMYRLTALNRLTR